MREEGIEPAPDRKENTWAEFIRIHAATLWQCDFFSKKVLSWTGWREYFVLVFIHADTRRVFATAATANPTEEWTSRQAQTFIEHARAQGQTGKLIVTRDHDGKYGHAFDATLKAADPEVVKIAVRAPNMQALIERFVQSIETECLDHFIPLGEMHLEPANRKISLSKVTTRSVRTRASAT